MSKMTLRNHNLLMALLSVLAPINAGAECAQLPTEGILLETALNDKFPFASEGVIWATANDEKKIPSNFQMEIRHPYATLRIHHR